MKAFSQLALLLCYLSVAVTILSIFIPQKRTRKIFGFVIGLFAVASLIAGFRDSGFRPIDMIVETDEISVPAYDSQEYRDMVVQTTAQNLVEAADEILRAEGICAEDIQLTLKISDEGRIYVNDIVIYISEEYLPRKAETESIIYRNFAKEPQVYVA